MSFVVDAVKSVGKAVVNVVKGVVKAVGKVVGAVVDFVGQAFMGMFGGAPDMGDGANEAARQQGVLLQKRGSDVNIPVIYGIRKVGGIVTYSETGSTDNKYLWVAYVLGEGPIAGIDELFIDDNQFTVDIVQKLNAGQLVEIANQPEKSPTEKYNGRCQFRFYPGIWYDTPSSSPIAANVKADIFAGAPEFTDRMIYNGLAVLFARYEWKKIETQADSDNNPFSGNIPEIQATVHGRLVEQLTTKFYNADGTLNNTLSGTMASNTDSAWNSNWTYNRNNGRWSNNPAEILFDYLRNPHYGKGLKSTDFDRVTWTNAANKCTQVVTYYSGITGPILTCNAVVDTGQSLFNNTKTLLTGFRAYMPYIQGKYKLKIEDAGNETDIMSGVATIVQQVTLNEIVGDITYTGIDKTSKYNQVVVTYVDPAQKWSPQQVVYPETEAKRQVYITEDGGRENKAEVTFGTLTNSSIAQDMARLIFNKSRFQETCSFKMSAQGFELEPGDNITIRGNLLNLTNTPWRVVSTKINNDYTVEVGCVRNPDNVILDNGQVGSFYPYGRYNEPDIIRPLYVPKGNLIYWPGVGGTNWGLLPPSSPPFPGDFTTPNAGSVGPTTPTNPTTPGGGNGSGGATNNGSTNVTVVNPPAVITRTYEDIVDFTSATFDSTTSSWTVTFTVPSNVPDYDGLLVWYQPTNIGDATQFYQLPVLAAGSRNFIFQGSSSNLVAYNIIARIKYQGGATSVKATTATIGSAGITNERGQVYNFSTITSVDSSFVNLDAEINLVSATVNASASPKSIAFTVKEAQLRYLATGVTGSTQMSAVVVYYKVPSATTYKERTWTLPASYAPNQEFTFTVADFGIGTNTTEYDVILRWKFKDGRLGNNIFYQKLSVVSSGTIQGAANGVRLASAMSIVVASDNTTYSLAVPTLTNIRCAFGQIKIYFQDPAVAPLNQTDFIGVKVSIAPVGTTAVGNYKTFTANVGAGLTKLFGQDIYEMAISDTILQTSLGYYNIVVQLGYVSGGVTYYSTKAVKYYGRFINGSEGLGNWTKNVEENVLVLLGDGGQSLTVAQPVIVPSSVQDMLSTAYGLSTAAIKVKSFKINFSLAGSVTKIRVYRLDVISGFNGCEYTDLTASDVVRYSIRPNSTTNISGNNALQLVSSTSGQEIYIRAYVGATASNSVLRIIPKFSASNSTAGVDVMGTPFDSVANTIDLTVDTALATKLNAATDAVATRIVFVPSDIGVTTGFIK